MFPDCGAGEEGTREAWSMLDARRAALPPDKREGRLGGKACAEPERNRDRSSGEREEAPSEKGRVCATAVQCPERRLSRLSGPCMPHAGFRLGTRPSSGARTETWLPVLPPST